MRSVVRFVGIATAVGMIGLTQASSTSAASPAFGHVPTAR